jgi:undecaprenyl-diphosphatase
MLSEIIKSIILGIVEGITEFLPISSTGHLILVNQWVRFSEPFTTMFDIVIQLGAILAVVVYFWHRLWPFGRGQSQTRPVIAIWFKMVVGVIPAIILGALLGSTIEEKLFNPWVVGIALLSGGIILIYVENRRSSFRFSSVQEIPVRTAFYIGVIQCLSMVPGTSRSAATIIGALLLGASRTAAVEFSFFLAIPTMVAASGYSLLKHSSTLTAAEFVILATGFMFAFLSALVVIRFFVSYIRRRDLKPFGYYRVVLGIIVVVFFLLR